MKRFAVQYMDRGGVSEHWVIAASRKEAEDFVRYQYREPISVEVLDLDIPEEAQRAFVSADRLPSNLPNGGPPRYLLSNWDTRSLVVEMRVAEGVKTRTAALPPNPIEPVPEALIAPRRRRKAAGEPSGKRGRPKGSLNRKTIEKIRQLELASTLAKEKGLKVPLLEKELRVRKAT